VLTSPGGLDGGVERQQVGLLGDVVDRLDQRPDPLAVRDRSAAATACAEC
jgi:hypothetical protein